MLVSFLVFGQIFTFLVAEYLVSIFHILGLFIGLLFLHSSSLSINKIESLNFPLVLKRIL